MQPLTALQLLEVWERAGGQPPVQRALALLAAASPEESFDSLAGRTIGQRDGQLLALREATFGPRLTAVADCPTCGAQLETELMASELLKTRPAGAGRQADTHEIEMDGYRVSFRLPNSQDLLVLSQALPGANQSPLAADGEAEVERGRLVLVERCLLDVSRQGHPLDAGRLPASLLTAVMEQMAAADPLADIRLSLTCPDCGHSWAAPFDITSYFWNEIETWAYRTLSEVHRLARAYGWSEAQILGVSAWRRQYYLSLL